MDDKRLTDAQKLALKWPLYVRMAFGLLVLFGMVGNCAGHAEQSAIVFMLVAVVWVNIRICQEAIASWQLLRMLNAPAAQPPKPQDDDKQDPPVPPNAAA